VFCTGRETLAEKIVSEMTVECVEWYSKPYSSCDLLLAMCRVKAVADGEERCVDSSRL